MGGGGDLLGEAEILRGERARLAEAHDDQAAGSVRDGDREQRGDGRALPCPAEPLVSDDRGRGEHLARRPSLVERRWNLDRAHLRGQPVRPGDRKPRGGRCQDRREISAERLGRRLRGRVVRLVERQRLSEKRRDAGEAALEPRLAGARLEALRVAKSQRGQRREGLEQLDIVVVETAFGVAHSDTEHAEPFARPHHRRFEPERERVVGGVGQAADDALFAVRHLRHPALRDELEPDQAGVESVDRGTAQDPPLAVDEIAIRRVDPQERRHLLDESQEDGVERQLARDDLGGVEQGLLLLEPAGVLVEETGGVKRRSELACNGVDEQQLGVGELRRPLDEQRRDAIAPRFDLDTRPRPAAESDLDPVEPEHAAELVGSDGGDAFRLDLGPKSTRDLGGGPLPAERLRESCGRTEPLEGERRLGGGRLEDAELLRREGPTVGRRGRREDTEHVRAGDHRHENAALRADAGGQPPADEGRSCDVVHDHRRGVGHGVRDTGGLVLEIDAHVLPPVGGTPVDLGVEPGRGAALRVDERHRRKSDVEQGRDVADERAGDSELVAGTHQLLRDRRDRLELPVADRDPLLGLEGPPEAAGHQPSLAPAEEQERGRDDREQDRHEREPYVPDHGPLLAQDEHAEDGRRGRDGREDEDDTEVHEVGPRP